jgi:hypothetical protein
MLKKKENKKKIHRKKIYIIAQNKIFNVRNYTNIVTSFLGVIGIDEGESVPYGHE